MLKFDINVPSNAYIFFKYFDEFLNFKIKFFDDYLEKIIQLITKNSIANETSDKD